MKKKVLIVAPYCTLPGDDRFNRFLYMAQILADENEVTLVTSTFMHHEKMHRKKQIFNVNFNIVELHEKGYKRNISFERIISIKYFTKMFNNWFINNNNFNFIISAFPLIGTNEIISKYRKKSNFKYILDIQDVWPESIKSAIPIMQYYPRQFLPYTRLVNKIYKSADVILAVSNTYLNRALEVSTPVFSKVLFIGSDFDLIKNAKEFIFTNNNIKLFYIGAMGPSYDILTIIKATNLLVSQGEAVELHLFGTGDKIEEFKKISSSNIIFHGQIPYQEMFSKIKSCDIALNALTKNASQSITNKLSDYLSLGCPIINSSENEEVASILKNKISSNYEAGSVRSFCNAFNEIKKNIEKNVDWIPDNRFNRKETYKIIKEILDLKYD